VPTLQFRFPGRRYHATPSGYHVNEGQIEWPPSPWRLLRALIACGFTTQHWSEIPPIARRMFEKLASSLPSYRLPMASPAHSRHFMPIGTLEKGREKTTLVFDTWADVGDEPLAVHWDCALTDEETQQLGQLTASLGYLGRSESWVEGELLADDVMSVVDCNAYPHRHGLQTGPDWEQISLIAAIPAHEYELWRREITAKLLDELPLPEGARKPPAKLLRDRATAVAPYPETLLDCLTRDTAWWKQHRWSQPPGSQRVVYWRRSDALQIGTPTRARRQVVQPVKVMLLALATASRNRFALPPCTRTLPQAELLHRAVVARVAKGQRVHCPELTGRDENGRPLQYSHRHAHILPVDLDGDGHLDHVIVYAPMGLGQAAQQAIRTLDRTWTKGGVGDLQIALAGIGDLDTLRLLPALLGRRVAQMLGPPEGARIWVSETPFVPPRFLKHRGGNTLFGQINSELASRGLPQLEQFDELRPNSDVISPRKYVRRRQRGGSPPPVDVGYALRLQLAAPINGPLTLGYASHFGLGLFVSEGPSPTTSADAAP